MRSLIVLCFLSCVLAKPHGQSYQLQSSSDASTGHQTTHTYHGATSSINQKVQPPSFLQEAQQDQQVNHASSPYSHYQSTTSTSPQFTPNQPNFSYSTHYNPTSTQKEPTPLFTPNFSSQYSQQPAYSYGQLQEYTKAQQNQHVQPTVTKDIFVHVAPRELEQYSAPRPLPQAPPRKHYRIVFIKAPSPPAHQASLQVQAAPVEEKTIIYVLTKKPDPIDIQAIQEAMQPKQIHKPEVYFIKYKTQEEAQHAQRAIQAEYDKLGGTSQISDEGVAPVTSVIGAFEHIKQQNNIQGSVDTHGGYSPNSSNSASGYLPPLKL